MYRETLMDQWKNVYSDFAGEYEILQHQGEATAAFNRWYEARVHRWSSMTYSEGILLEQENNPEFSAGLRSVLKSFRFSKVEAGQEKPSWPGIAAGVAAGILVGGILMLLHWGRIKAIISGAVMLVVVVAAFSRKNADDAKQEQKRVRESYIRQLKDYQRELIAVCDQYQVK